MENWGIVMMITYSLLGFFVLSTRKREFDILKVRLGLLPFWFKFIGFGWLIFVVCYSYIYNRVYFAENNFLFTGINIGLLLIVLSRDRKEDEFSDLIRLRSMYLSAITLFFLAGTMVSMTLLITHSYSKNTIVFLVILLDVTLMVYLTNYYWSKYLINK